MAATGPSVFETRREQVFPILEPAEIERLRRFGEVRRFEAGETLRRIGEAGHGLAVILTGRVEITQNDAGQRQLITTHEAGAFMGELTQLSGRPALSEATAVEPVEALIIPPQKLRAVLIAEAELGERIMRALILRRMGLLELGAGGPVIVGPADHGDVLRLGGFLSRSGHPHQSLDPETIPEARALVERFGVALLHGSDCARIECIQSPNSSDADGSRTPKLKHAVQGRNGDGDFGRATPICSRAQRISDHSFKPTDGSLHQSPTRVPGPRLPAHASMLRDVLEMPIALGRLGLRILAQHCC
jgi:CRP-like cAMP-binding protein